MAVRSLQEYFNNFTNGNDAANAYVMDGGTQGDSTYNQLKNSSKSKFGSAIKPSSSKTTSSPSTGVDKSKLGLLQSLETKPEFGTISDLEKTKIDDYLNLRERKTNVYKELLQDIYGQLSIESQLRTDINEKIGISGELSRGLRGELLDSQPAAIEFGYGIKDITEMITSMMEQSGRFNLISRETIDKSFSTARAFVGNYKEMGALFNEFERVGIGARGAMEAIDKAGTNSLSLGLRAKTTVTDIRTNIEKLNEYGFKNGIQGLAEMSRKATEFRFNMQKVFDIAEKVMDPEAALSLTANLQVLGGAISDFNDPLKLMNMATNNVEGLTDSLIGAAEGLATYNAEQGRFEVSGANLRRARDMAKELGMSTGELTKVAIASQERLSAAMDLAGRGFNINEEDKRFITNLSKMDKGRMVIEIPQTLQDKFRGETQIALSDLTREQVAVLQENKKAFEDMSPTDIAKDQLSTLTNIYNYMQSWAKGNVRAITSAANVEGNLDKVLKPLMNVAKDYGERYKLDDEQIKSFAGNLKEDVYKAYFSGGMEDAKNLVNDKIKELQNKQQEKVKEDDRKREEESKKTTAMNVQKDSKILVKSDIRVINSGGNIDAAVNNQYFQMRDYLSNELTYKA